MSSEFAYSADPVGGSDHVGWYGHIHPEAQQLWAEGLRLDPDVSSGETLMAVSDDRVLAQAQLLTQRAQEDTLHRMGQAMQTLMSQMGEVRESVIRIEAQDVKQQFIDMRAEMKALSVRTQQLENVQEQRKGAFSFLAWLKDYTPWILAAGAAVLAYIGRSKI